MNKYSFFSVLLLLIGSFYISASAQASKGQEFYDGWIVMKKGGDTLTGKICYENTKTGELYDKIFFMDTTGQKRRYGAEKLSGFSYNGKLFEYVLLPVEDMVVPPMLMQTLVKGDAILYKHWYKNPESTPQKFMYDVFYYLMKQDNPKGFAEIDNKVSDKNFRRILRDFFEGDEQILNLVKENSWTINDLEKIVTAYNDLE